MTKNLYTILHIEDNCIEHMSSFTNCAKATTQYKNLIKQKFPHLKAKQIENAIENGILIAYKGDTYNFITQKHP